MTPADELRTAAATLRKLTETATPGNWWSEELPPDEDHKRPAHWVKTEYEDGNNCLTSQVVADCPWKQADAAYIAAMHPGVGAALALLLEGVLSSAREADHEECSNWCSPETCDMSAALAVARQINGNPS